MKRLAILLFVVAGGIVAGFGLWRQFGTIRLIVRGDDMGFSHAANVGCIEAYRNGILTTVEVMVPCESFFEAAHMLAENPGLDVGIHLTLTSEWPVTRWGPLTSAPSLVDENGHFYAETAMLAAAHWNLEEIEHELRAQIELALRHLPSLSHATAHMAFPSISWRVRNLTTNLMREYGIDANLRALPMRQIDLFGDAETTAEMVANAVEVLNHLRPGTYEAYVHPALLAEEPGARWPIGAGLDPLHRDRSTKALLDATLREVTELRRIRLIGYRDL